MAGTTGLEPATSAVTGQRSNQLSYVPSLLQLQVGWDSDSSIMLAQTTLVLVAGSELGPRRSDRHQPATRLSVAEEGHLVSIFRQRFKIAVERRT